MKKITLTLLIVIASFSSSIAQALLTVKAPLDATTTQVRAPNGLSTYAYLRAVSIVLGSELTSIAPGTTLTAFGFTLDPGSVVSALTAGNFTVYMENTSDVNNNKSTTYATAIAPMQTVYTGTMTLTPTTNSVLLTLSAPFTYTGGGIYIAYDWYSAGPYSSTPATYRASGTGPNPGTLSNNSSSSAPTTLGTTAFRPSFLFGYNNPYSNDIQIITLDANGKIAGMFNQPQIVNAFVKNSGGSTQNNIVASLNVSGANTFVNTQTITSLAAGSSTMISFASYTPAIAGLNTVSVSVPSDQNNVNNAATFPQSVTCNQSALNPPSGNYTTAIGFGTGSGMIVTSFTNPITSTLTGMRGAISTDVNTPGNTSYGALLSSSGVILATTNTITISAGMLGTFQSYTFATPPALSAGTAYYYGFVQPANTTAYYPAGVFAGSFFPSVYYTAALTGGVLTPLPNTYGYFGIEGVYSPVGPTVTVTSPTVTCGGAATLAATTSASYTWTSGPANANFVVTPITNSIYSLTAINTLGCAGTKTAAVTVNSIALTVNSPTICSGNSVSIVPGGAGIGGTYSITGNNFTVTPTSTSFYSVTGTATNGCVSSAATSTVSVNATPSIAVNNPVSCSGASVIITPTAAGITSFTITGGTFTVAPGSTTSYSVTGTGTNGCISSNTAVASVSVNITPAVSVNSATICSGKSATLIPSGAGTGGTYSITGGTFTVSPGTNATYSVTGTSSAGCTSTVSAVASVSVNASPTLGVNSAAICQGSTLALVPNGASGGTYTISGNSFTVSPAASISYSVTGTATNGCAGSNTAIASVIVNATPTIAVNSATICSGASVTITPTGAGTYTITGNSFTVTPGTTSSYSVTGTSTNGCLSQNPAVSTVSVNITPTLNAANTAICLGSSAVIVASGANTYSITGNSFTVTPSVTTSYSITGIGSNGCVGANTAIATVSVNPNPTITVNSGTVCSGSAFTIAPSGAQSYTVTGGTFTIHPTSTASYSVGGIDLNGCASAEIVSSVSVIAAPLLVVAVAVPTICAGESASLGVSGAISYTWSTTDQGTVIAVSPTVTTTYTVTGTGSNGCSSTGLATQAVSPCTGLKANGSAAAIIFGVYPNPNNGVFTIETVENAEIFVINAIGQIVYSEKSADAKSTLSMEHLPNGIYFVKAIAGRQQAVVKIIKE